MAVTTLNVIFGLIFGTYFFEFIKAGSGVYIKRHRYIVCLLVLWSMNIISILAFSTQPMQKLSINFVAMFIIGKIAFNKISSAHIMFFTFLHFACGLFADITSFYIFSLMGVSVIDVLGSNSLILISNTYLLLILSLAVIVIKLIKARYGKVNDSKNLSIWNRYIGIALIILFTNIYLISMYQVNKSMVEKFIWFIPITLFIVVIFAAYSQFLVRYKEHKNSQLQYYLNTMTKLSSDIKQFKHDFKNVLISLYGLAEKEEWNDLRERLLELQGSNITQYSSDIEAMVNIREQSLVSLLAAKMFYANKLNINFFIEAPHIVDEMPIKGTDFIRMVGILLDNAIEAAQQCSKPSVGAIFLSYKDYFELMVVNSVESSNIEIAAIEQQGFSTRGIGRGTGLSSLASILENHQPVEWNTFIKNNMFTQCIGFKRK